jgi:fibronectin type III domain protein
MQTLREMGRGNLSRIGRWLFWAGVTAALVLFPRAVSAGTIQLAWDPVSDADVLGYRVYYGTSSGSYSQFQWVAGKGQTSATLQSLQDCMTYFMAVKAVDSSGNESPAFSNEISGISAPILTSITTLEALCMGGVHEGDACGTDADCAGPRPDGSCTNSVCRGGFNDGSPCTSTANCSDNGACSNKAGRQGIPSLNVVVTGTNFDPQARPYFGPDVTVNTWSSVSCSELDANISIDETARVNNEPAGPAARLVSVVNVADRARGTGPTGSQSGLFTVVFDHARTDLDHSGEVFTRDILFMMQQNYPFNSDGSPKPACVSPDPCYDTLKGFDLNGDGIVADGRDVSILQGWYFLLHL